MADLMSCTDHVGCAWRVSAATPATWGDAIEVPDRNLPPLPVPDAVEKMLRPGPVISGLRALSPVRGPPEENDAKAEKAGFGKFWTDSAAVVPTGEACS